MLDDSGHISIYAHAIHKTGHFLRVYNEIGRILSMCWPVVKADPENLIRHIKLSPLRTQGVMYVFPIRFVNDLNI